MHHLPVPNEKKSQLVPELGGSKELPPPITIEREETAAQIAISDGLPAWVGASAALALAGSSLAAAMIAGIASAVLLTIVHRVRSHSL